MGSFWGRLAALSDAARRNGCMLAAGAELLNSHPRVVFKSPRKCTGITVMKIWLFAKRALMTFRYPYVRTLNSVRPSQPTRSGAPVIENTVLSGSQATAF
jgi:hypothetical protein